MSNHCVSLLCVAQKCAAYRWRASLFLARKRQERDVSAPLHRDGDLALMPRAVAGDASGKDLATLGDEESERLDVLVINERRLVNAEAADLFPDLKTPLVRASAVPAVSSSTAASRVRRSF
jgi:hypothetical protein